MEAREIEMRIATWNVNSVRARLPRVLAWLERRQPDIACFQEIKVVDEDFPVAEFAAIGYRAITFGQKTYNGVAILSHEEATAVVRGLPDDPPDAERRVLAATIGGVRVVNLYCPNGGEINSDKYAFKLVWFRRLRAFLDAAFDPRTEVLLCGDFNIAPEDRDVWDPEAWRGQTLFSEPEKTVLRELMAWGLADTLRLHSPESGLFTWWDYRMGAFHRGWGLRIDHHFASAALAARCTSVEIDRDERKGDKPSDHAPVVATFF
ncbi:MAG: exodeoxyribonuclease III [Thermoanaerobaculales bacterium]